MSKHIAKHGKKTARRQRAVRPLKRTHGKKASRVKKPVTRQKQPIREAPVEQPGLETGTARIRFVDLKALGQNPESIGDVTEVFEIEVVNGEREVTLEDSD